MKTRLFPFFKSSVRTSSVLVASITMMLGAHSASAATLYWDTDGTTSGFGTASGTWDTDAFWSTDATGAAATAATVTATGDLINFGTGTLGLAAGPVAVSGTVSTGNITFGSASGAIVLTGGTITLDPAAIITVDNASDSISSILAGATTSLVKNGTGMLTLSGANTYTGATTLSAGSLSVATSGNLGAAASNLVFDGGTLQITGTALTSLSGIGHTVSFTAAKTIGFDINTAANIFTADQVLNQTTGGLTKAGAGTLILNQANTYTGLSTLSAGTLVMGHTQALGTNSTTNTISFTGTTAILDIATAGADTAYKSSAVSGTIFTVASNVKTGSVGINHTLGTLGIGGSATAGLTRLNIVAGGAVLSGTPSITFGAVTLSSGAASVISTFNPTTASLTLASVTTSGATTGTKVLNLDGTSTGNFVTGAIINGTSSLAVTKTNTSTWTLSGASTFTGGTTIAGGLLRMNGATSTIGSINNTLTINAGALDLNGANQGVGILTGSIAAGTNAIYNSATGTSTLTLGNNNATGGIFAGTISNTNGAGAGIVALTKTGTGTQTLSGANTYTGVTTVSGGRLLLGNGGGLAATAVTVGAGTFGVARNASGTINALGSALTMNSGSALTMGDTFTSTLNVAGAANLYSGTPVTAPVYTFDISGTNGVNDTLVIAGSASLTSVGAKVSINALGALTVGNSYTLISGGAGSSLATNGLSLSTSRVVGGGNTYSVSLANTATTSTLTVSGILSLYWSGSQNAVWNTSNTGPLTNWNTDATSGVNSGAIPTSTTDVYFNTSTPVATNLTNTLGADTSIYSLNYSAASGAVVIGAGNNLTLGAGGLANLSSSTQTINSPIILGSNQTWTNSAGATLTIGGTITGTAKQLIFGGTGTTQLNGSLNNVTTNSSVSAGANLISSGGASLTAVFINSGTMTINGGNFATSGQFTVSAGTLNVTTGGTLTQTGTGVQFSNSGTSTINLSGGRIDASVATYIRVGHQAGKSTLNLNSGVFDTGVHFSHNTQTSGNVVNFNGATVRIFASLGDLIDPTYATRFTLNNVGGGGGAVIDTQAFTLGISAPILNTLGTGALDGGLTKLGSGTLTLTGASTYTGATTITAGTLQLGDGTSAVKDGTTSSSAGITNNGILIYNRFGTPTSDRVISGTGSVVKIGPGTQTLTGANTYTGNTTVSVGTLSLSSPYLANASTLTIATGAFLNLNYTGTDIVASLNLGGLVKTTGTFDSTNSGGLITGSGKIQVGAAAANFSTWATANGITGEPATGDFDKDGLSNLVEYALGLNPTTSSVPVGTFIGGVLSYTKGSEAFANGDLTYEIETSTTLGAWSVVVANNPAQSTMSYTLPTGLPKQFARLKVTQIP